MKPNEVGQVASSADQAQPQQGTPPPHTPPDEELLLDEVTAVPLDEELELPVLATTAPDEVELDDAVDALDAALETPVVLATVVPVLEAAADPLVPLEVAAASVAPGPELEVVGADKPPGVHATTPTIARSASSTLRMPRFSSGALPPVKPMPSPATRRRHHPETE